jgi:Flp pilus assembly pilin Flp
VAFWREDPGQDLVEYSLLIAFMAMACIAVFMGTGNSVKGPWGHAGTTLATANGAQDSIPLPPPATPPEHDHE